MIHKNLGLNIEELEIRYTTPGDQFKSFEHWVCTVGIFVNDIHLPPKIFNIRSGVFRICNQCGNICYSNIDELYCNCKIKGIGTQRIDSRCVLCKYIDI